MLAEDGIKRLIDEGGFSAAADAGDDDEFAQGEFGVDIFEVIAFGAFELEKFTVAFPSFFGYGNFAMTVEIGGSKGIQFKQVGRAALGDDPAAVETCFWADIDEIVRSQHN